MDLWSDYAADWLARWIVGKLYPTGESSPRP